MLSQSSIFAMCATLFYCVRFTTLITEHTYANDDHVPNICQSLDAEAAEYEGKCDCFQQLLEIRCEGLTRVPKFSGFNCAFVGVYMAKQSIRRLEENAFARLPTRRLVLDFNDIEDRLHAAAFSGNLSEIVQELYLGACRLRNLPSGLFDEMHNLMVLHLWHNNIQHLPGRVFVSCGNLRELVLSHNILASVDESTFTGLQRLRKLDLDCNRISVLSRDVFKELTDLEVLYMRHNKVTVLSADTFSFLGNSLFVLSFDDNGLEFVYSRAFDGLTRLKCLSLGDNKMTFLPGDAFANMPNLTTLILRRSNLSSLFSRLFGKLISLKRLDLSGNNLGHVPVGSLRNSEQLRYLDLSDNNITTLSSCTLSETASQLSTLSLLGNNNLQCDCRLAWIANLQSANIWGICARTFGFEGPTSVTGSLQYKIAGCSFDAEDCTKHADVRTGRHHGGRRRTHNVRLMQQHQRQLRRLQRQYQV